MPCYIWTIHMSIAMVDVDKAVRKALAKRENGNIPYIGGDRQENHYDSSCQRTQN